jgi:hypothetical protein
VYGTQALGATLVKAGSGHLVIRFFVAVHLSMHIQSAEILATATKKRPSPGWPFPAAEFAILARPRHQRDSMNQNVRVRTSSAGVGGVCTDVPETTPT